MSAWVFDAVRATHTHEEAIDGALVIAMTVGRLSRLADVASFDANAFLFDLSPHCRTMEMRSRIMQAARLLDDETTDEEVVSLLGNGVRTSESVPTALYAAMRYAEDPEEAVVRAIGYGGDTDTIAAMTGAMVGALHGAASFPERWHAGLERGEAGYDVLCDLSAALAKISE